MRRARRACAGAADRVAGPSAGAARNAAGRRTRSSCGPKTGWAAQRPARTKWAARRCRSRGGCPAHRRRSPGACRSLRGTTRARRPLRAGSPRSPRAGSRRARAPCRRPKRSSRRPNRAANALPRRASGPSGAENGAHQQAGHEFAADDPPPVGEPDLAQRHGANDQRRGLRARVAAARKDGRERPARQDGRARHGGLPRDGTRCGLGPPREASARSHPACGRTKR